MAYTVKIEKTEVDFHFINIDDAMNFASMATEYGIVEDYHYERNENNEPFKVSDGWRPAKVTFGRVVEVENE